MSNDRVMMIAEKETFMIRVLEKKLEDAGVKCSFKSWNVNDIHDSWEGTGLVVAYMEEDQRPSEHVMHFLMDKNVDEGVRVIFIGEKPDIDQIVEQSPEDLIYKAFKRPIDNDVFVNCVVDHFEKLESGEFKKSILVVDDDANYLSLVREWLKDTYKVSMVNSGLQAIKWLGKNKVDLILLDHEMPVTSGPQVLEMLRSDEETRNIPVIFLTGKNDKESVMAVVALKPEGYLLKNIEKKELLDTLNDYFMLHK